MHSINLKNISNTNVYGFAYVNRLRDRPVVVAINYDSLSFSTFKSRLKTHLFSSCFLLTILLACSASAICSRPALQRFVNFVLLFRNTINTDWFGVELCRIVVLWRGYNRFDNQSHRTGKIIENEKRHYANSFNIRFTAVDPWPRSVSERRRLVILVIAFAIVSFREYVSVR